MSWAEHHKLSERLASEAQVALLQGRRTDALKLYACAADAEVRALADLDRSKTRTVGISAVSAASLYRKADNLERTEEVAAQWLSVHTLPDFAKEQLRGILRSIWVHAPAAARNDPSMPRHQRTPTEVETAPRAVSYMSTLISPQRVIPAGTHQRTHSQAKLFQSNECVQSNRPADVSYLLSRTLSILSKNDVEAA